MNFFAAGEICVLTHKHRNQFTNKTLLFVMRSSFIYCLIIIMSMQLLLASPGNGQVLTQTKVTLELKKEPLELALQKIEAQTDFLFAYQPKQVIGCKNISITKATRTLEATLDLILKNTKLGYKVSGNNIILFKEEVEKNTIEKKLRETLNIINIKGKVTNERGEPIAGASVLVKGADIGAETDLNGFFSIDLENEKSILIFSYVGFETIEIEVGTNRNLKVILKPVSSQLNEVVVTSFGVKQNKRGLGYAVQSVDGKALTEAKQPNLINALQGKVAGLQITSSNGVPGASASIVLRGGTSLDGNNEPLFVIDGVPIDNSTIAEPANGGGQLARTVSNSNRAVDINPDDIESISVLKGPAAAALYGLRASGGAIIITTKKGVSGEGKVSFGTSVELQKANKLPDLQKQYKMGIEGNAVPSRLSWGPSFGNNDEVFNNMEEFFQTGTLYNNNLSFGGSNEKSSIFASVNRTDQKGIVPNSDFTRTSFRVNAETALLKKLKLGLTSNYINSKGTKPLQGPGVLNGTGGVMGSIVYWPLSDNMADYLNPDGSRRRLVPNIQEDIDNPYWSVNKNPITNNVNRFIGTMQVSYEVSDWLNLTCRLGTDFYKEDYRSVRSPGTSLNGNANGGLYESDNFNQVTTSTFLASAKKAITKDLNFSLLLGHNAEWNNYRNNSVYGLGFLNSEFVGINNTQNKIFNQFLSRRRLVGVFGDLQFSYKNWFFINTTGRNDWSSTLPEQNRSFFYPSIGSSIVLTEIVKIDSKILDYAKIRGTYAQVGKDAPPHKLGTILETAPGIVLGGDFGFGFYSNNATLKPEFTNSFEIGAELQFLNRRIGFDITWYKLESKDQITQPRVSQGTGFIFKLVNGGTIVNKGVEIVLNAIPVKKEKFTWDISLNWSHNKARVTQLPVGTSVFRNSDAIAVFNLAEGASFLNGDFYAIRGSTYLTNSNGEVLIGANGYPTVSKTNQVDLGVSRQPEWIAGLTNNITYKNVSLGFLIDIRKGGYVFNGTEYELVKSGLSTKTSQRGQNTILPGVVEKSPGIYTPNTTPVILDQNYFTSIYAENARNFIEDGSWYRLRYISLSYSMPSRLLRKTPFASLSVNVTGKNLLLITDYSGFDPELSSGGAGVRGTGTVGMDYLGLPSAKGVYFGVNASF